MLRSLVVALLSVLALAPTATAGVQPGLTSGHGHASSPADPHAEAQRAGARWARVVVEWGWVEWSGKGVLDPDAMAHYDWEIAGYRSRGIDVLVSVVGTPHWAADYEHGDAHTVRPPRDPADYADVVRRLAERPGWKGQVAAYEVWSGQNTARAWHPAPDAGRYTALLKAASSAVRQADPAADVVFGGLDGADLGFLAAAYDAGMTGDDIDAIGVDMATACRIDMPSAAYREADGRIGRYAFTGYRELYEESVDRGAPEAVWLTGLGISAADHTCAEGPGAGSRPTGVGEAQQAEFLGQAYACLAADAFVGPALWHTLQDGGAPSSGTGLLRDDGSDRPAFGVFSALRDGIAPNASCGARADRVSPRVTIAAPPTFTGTLPLKLTATDAETAVGRMYFTIRRASDPPETQVQIPGGGQGGAYALDWTAAKDLPLGVAHVVTGYALDEGRNLGGASVSVTRVAPTSTTAPQAPQAPQPGATGAAVDVTPKKGRRAIAKATLTYVLPQGTAIKGRGRLLFEYFKPRKGRAKAEWVTAARFTVLASALRRARVLDRAHGVRQAAVTKAVRLRGKAAKWRVLFEFDGTDPFQDSRAMAQFRAKG